MDLKVFEAFLESQETALEVILAASKNKIDQEDARKAIDRHVARTTRKVRNIFPAVPNPAISPADATLSSTITHKKPTPKKPTPVKTPSRRLFTAPPANSGSRSHGHKRAAPVSTDVSSAGSPSESPLTGRAEKNVLEGIRQSNSTSRRFRVPPSFEFGGSETVAGMEVDMATGKISSGTAEGP